MALPKEIVRFKVLYLIAIWEGEAGEAGEAPAELLRHGSAGASPVALPTNEFAGSQTGRFRREGRLRQRNGVWRGCRIRSERR